jgi:thymidine kinase
MAEDDRVEKRKARCQVCMRHCPLVLTIKEGKVIEIELDEDALVKGAGQSGNYLKLCHRTQQLKGKDTEEVYKALAGPTPHVIRLY